MINSFIPNAARYASLLAALLLAQGPASAGCNTPPGPVYRHSHNDYTRKHPLLDAMMHDFDSVEADIYLKDGQLLVCHDSGDCHKNKTLEGMYLLPLFSMYQAGKGLVRPNHKQLTLLVEFKSDPDKTYQAVLPLLQRYKAMLTAITGGKVRNGAVRVVITGHVPRKLIKAAEPKLMAIDGEADDLGSGESVSLVPWISIDWDKRGKSIEDLACRARQQHRLLRFWGGPDNSWQWGEECKDGVDIINTDHLTKLNRFMPRCRALRDQKK